MIKSTINNAISRPTKSVGTMKSINIVGVLVSLILIGFASAEIVRIDDGLVEGTILRSREERSFYAFMGIPYAQPPINNLRFQAPVPVEPWTDTLSAISYGPMCYQIPRTETTIQMSEDCLQINVFSPNLTASLPVIVYIFGGGFVYGTGIDQGQPEHLMDRNVVVVNFNYRLGALGFLAVGTREIPGNAGMKDQILALQWVQRNIASFGGNPNSVTIAGLSAGGVSVTGHMLSPMAQGLFHRVISISGAIASMRTTPTGTGEDVARRLASSLNCTDTSDINATVNCLRDVGKNPFVLAEKTFHSILNFQRQPNAIVTAVMDNPPCTRNLWGPVVEPDLGQTRYLETDPDTLLKNGSFARVPVLIGITADEFAERVPG